MTIAYDTERVYLLAQEMVSAIDQLRTHGELDEYVSWSLIFLKRKCKDTSFYIKAHRGDGKCDSRG